MNLNANEKKYYVKLKICILLIANYKYLISNKY